MQACTQAGYSLSQTAQYERVLRLLLCPLHIWFFFFFVIFLFFCHQFNSFPKSLNSELTDLASRSLLPWSTAWGASILCGTITCKKPLSTSRNCFTQTPNSPLTCCYFPTPSKNKEFITQLITPSPPPPWGILPSSDYTSLKFWKITARGLRWGFLVLQKYLPACLHAVRQVRGEGVRNTNNK